jgi:hypothetical protein
MNDLQLVNRDAVPACRQCGEPSPNGDPCDACKLINLQDFMIEETLVMSDEEIMAETTSENIDDGCAILAAIKDRVRDDAVELSLMARIERAVALYRNAPFRSADWLASEMMTILDRRSANDPHAFAPQPVNQDAVREALEGVLTHAADLVNTASHHGNYASIHQDKIDGLRDAVQTYEAATLATPPLDNTGLDAATVERCAAVAEEEGAHVIAVLIRALASGDRS